MKRRRMFHIGGFDIPLRDSRAKLRGKAMMIEFWDLGNNCKITISRDSIQRFAPVSSRQGTNIFLKSGPSIWVQEDYETVKKLVASTEAT